MIKFDQDGPNAPRTLSQVKQPIANALRGHATQDVAPNMAGMSFILSERWQSIHLYLIADSHVNSMTLTTSWNRKPDIERWHHTTPDRPSYNQLGSVVHELLLSLFSFLGACRLALRELVKWQSVSSYRVCNQLLIINRVACQKPPSSRTFVLVSKAVMFKLDKSSQSWW